MQLALFPTYWKFYSQPKFYGCTHQCHSLHVCIVIIVARENALAKSGKPYAIALHSFRGGQPGDLPLVKGELIELTGSVGSDWLRGKAGDKEGIFPGI